MLSMKQWFDNSIDDTFEKYNLLWKIQYLKDTWILFKKRAFFLKRYANYKNKFMGVSCTTEYQLLLSSFSW